MGVSLSPCFPVSTSPSRGAATRTLNLRFWRPLLYQLSYTPSWSVVLCPSSIAASTGRRLPVLSPGFHESTDKAQRTTYYFLEVAGSSRILVTTPEPTVRPPSRMAKRRPSSMAIGDFGQQLDGHLDVVAGHAHFDALAAARRCRSRRWCGSRTAAVAGEERRVPAAFFLRQHVDVGLELGVRRDASRAWRAPGRAPVRSASMPRSSTPTLSPAMPYSSVFWNISTPVMTVLRGVFHAGR